MKYAATDKTNVLIEIMMSCACETVKPVHGSHKKDDSEVAMIRTRSSHMIVLLGFDRQSEWPMECREHQGNGCDVGKHDLSCCRFHAL